MFIDGGGGGSGKFVRVHFKNNAATVVRDLLFSLNVTPVLSIQKHLSSFHAMEIFFDIYSVVQPLCFFVCSP